MNVPVASNSTSIAVTSAVISGSGAVEAVLVAATCSLAPILAPDLAITVRSGSRNRRLTRSGRFRVSLTSAETSCSSRSSGSGVPSKVMLKALLNCGSAMGHRLDSAGASSSSRAGISKEEPGRNRNGSSMSLNAASRRHSVGSPYS